MKIIVTIIATNLVTNFVFILLFTFLTNQKKESGFQQVDGVVNEKYFCFLFTVSRALLQSHTEFNRIL